MSFEKYPLIFHSPIVDTSCFLVIEIIAQCNNNNNNNNNILLKFY